MAKNRAFLPLLANNLPWGKPFYYILAVQGKTGETPEEKPAKPKFTSGEFCSITL